jgi:hypothetical protein
LTNDYAQQQFCNRLADGSAIGSKSLISSGCWLNVQHWALVLIFIINKSIGFSIGRRTTEVQPIAKLIDVACKRRETLNYEHSSKNIRDTFSAI